MYLGNLQFNQIREHMGYELNEKDKELWNKYHNNQADLSGMNNCFHVFHIPTCIHVKGQKALDAIMEMLTNDKLVEPMGEFEVKFYKQ